MTKTEPLEDYPEHAKMLAIVNQSQAIGEFLETSGYVLAKWVDTEEECTGDDCYDDHPHLVATRLNTEQVLAEHFGIDLTKVEAEKRAMLETMRLGQS
jgi:hypothetical protein